MTRSFTSRRRRRKWSRRARRANRRAFFYPRSGAGTLPAVEVGGVLAFLYAGLLDDDRNGIRLSLELDTAEPWLRVDPDTVPVEIAVNGTVVFSDAEMFGLLAGHVLTALAQAGAIEIRLHPHRLEITAGGPAGRPVMSVAGRFTHADAARALGVPAAAVTLTRSPRR